MDERRSYSSLAVSTALHGALWRCSCSASPRRRDSTDSPESIPVETISLSELNQIMNGEKDAKPAPQPPPAPHRAARLRRRRAATAAAELRRRRRPAAAETGADAAAQARAHAASESRAAPPPPRPEPTRPTPACAAEAAARTRRPSRRAAEAVDLIARAAEGPTAGEAKPTHAYDPNAIAKLIGQKAPPAPAAAPTERRPRRRRGCRTTTRRACRCRWPRRSTHG